MSNKIKISRGNKSDFETVDKDNDTIYMIYNSDDTSTNGKVYLGGTSMVDPDSHTSEGTEYGVGTAVEYGHVKLSDLIDSTTSATGGVAATPLAVSTALNNISFSSINLMDDSDNGGEGWSTQVDDSEHHKFFWSKYIKSGEFLPAGTYTIKMFILESETEIPGIRVTLRSSASGTITTIIDSGSIPESNEVTITVNEPVDYISLFTAEGATTENTVVAKFGIYAGSNADDTWSSSSNDTELNTKTTINNSISEAISEIDTECIIYITKEEYDALVASGDVDEDKYYSYDSEEDGEVFSVSQTTGTSISSVMSQNATTLAIANAQLGDGIELVQETGTSTTSVMSQKAVTDCFFREEMQDLLAYGIQFDTTVSSPTCTRLGSSMLHKTLPIQSGMRGCRLDDDGVVVGSYLPDTNWDAYNLNEKQVMVEIPVHYRKFVTDGTVRQVWISEYPIEGYTKVPIMYVSAYEATVNRTTNKLCSVVNTTTDYRGGNNKADYDDTYRTFLGRPASNIQITEFRTYARNRKEGSTEWNCMTYEAHKTIFWLFATEYATLNSQADINAELTSEGYKQGGLGSGPTTLSSTSWSNFNSYYPFIPCGYTNSLGNGTGEMIYEVYDEGNDVTISTYANRYRGIENPFGHLWQWTDGIVVDIRTDDYDGDYAGESRVFVATDPTNFVTLSTLADSYEGYEYRGLQARASNSYIKEIIFGNYGDIVGEVVSGSSTTYFCDYNYTSVESSSIRAVRLGGCASNDVGAGFNYLNTIYTPYTSDGTIGSRLCFHPNEN